MSTIDKPMQVKFHMRSGATVIADNVKDVEMTRHRETGAYCAYHLEFMPNSAPRLFTLSIPDIISVVAVNMPPAPMAFVPAGTE